MVAKVAVQFLDWGVNAQRENQDLCSLIPTAVNACVIAVIVHIDRDVWDRSMIEDLKAIDISGTGHQAKHDDG
jgi:hypothetical protein